MALLLAVMSCGESHGGPVSLILIGDMQQGWRIEVVGFHRTETTGNLVVNFVLGGTATAGADYSVAPGSTITIPMATARRGWSSRRGTWR
jgi:hypothetical protein